MATTADANYLIKFAGEASRMAAFHLSRAARRRTWRQDSGVGNVNVAAGARQNKGFFIRAPFYPPPFRSFFSSAEAPHASSIPSDVLITILCEIEEFHQVRPARTHSRPPPPAMTIFVV